MSFSGRLSILMISPSYYPHIGGVEYVVKSVAERLTKKGHNVYILCGEQGIDKPVEEIVNGIPVTRWPTRSPGGAYHIPMMRSKLREWLIKHVRGCDVVHFHSVHSIFTMYSLNILKNFNVRKVLTPYYHGTGHTFLRRILWQGWRLYVKKLLHKVDVLHTVSRLEAQLIKRDFKVEATPIENGVDEWIFNVSWSPSGYVMYSGRIEKYKNIHRLANIVKILNLDQGLNLELKVYGSGSYLGILKNYLEKLGVKYSINPPQPFEKYIEMLSKATLFCLLSEKESYPQSVNEANAIGVPVVIAEPWGQNFYGRSRTLIVKLDESDKLIAKKISLFLSEAEKQSKSEVPSWDQVVDKYIKTLYVGL